MQVILLAAGQSTRLDPIEDKNLLEFAGKSLIEHRIAALKKANMRDIVVVGGRHNLEQLKTILKKYKNVMVIEQENLKDGMAGGVLAGNRVIKHKNVMVVSTNDVFDYSLFEKALAVAKQSDDGVIVGKRVSKYFPGGYLKFDKKMYVTDIIEKPGEGKEPSDIVNMVLHIYNDFPKFIDFLSKATGKADDRYERALDKYIKKGKAKIKVFKYNGYWQPIKFPWHILEVMRYFMSENEHKIDRTADVSKFAHLKGQVYIGPKVKVFENAIIHGPAYIGEGAIIATNALVRESMIGNNCVVGFATEVARSYLNHDVWMHSNYIGDSVIDHNVSFGAGTVLGNLRFDEECVKVKIKGDRQCSGINKLGAIIGSGVRFGVNCSTNPGVKIGKNVFVGPNVIVDKDIEDGKMALLDQKLKITPNKKTADVKNRK